MSTAMQDRTRRLEVLAALAVVDREAVFAVRTRMLVGSDALGSPNGRVLVETLVELLARTLSGVDVLPPPDATPLDLAWLRGLADRCSWQHENPARVALGAPAQDTDLTVVVGSAVPPDGLWIGVGATGWTGRVGRRHQLLVRPSRWPFGALAASAIASAAVIQLAIERLGARAPLGPLTGDSLLVFDAAHWRLHNDPGASDESQFEQAMNQRMPPLAIIGGGAVGHTLAWTFGRSPVAFSRLTWFEGTTLDDTSLNRCLGARPSDAGQSKLETITRALQGHASALDSRARAWTSAEPIHGVVCSTVDLNAPRHDVQAQLPTVLYSGSTSDASASVSRHDAGGLRSCLICRHPDRNAGAPRVTTLSLADVASRLGLTEAEVHAGKIKGHRKLSPQSHATLVDRFPEAQDLLDAALQTGADVCGMIGDIQQRFGSSHLPVHASFGASSLVAGLGLAVAFVLEQLSPNYILDNVFEYDLFAPATVQRGRIAQPPVHQCPFCIGRAADIARVRARRFAETSASVPRSSPL